MTKQDLQDQLKQAMLAQDEVKKSVLRMLISAIGYYEIQKGGAGYVATDEDVMSVLGTQVKQHRDSIEQFEQAGRTELVAKEKEELDILQSYMPAQLSEDEVKALITEAIAATGASAASDMGKVMGYLSPKIKGKADGGMVSKFVKERLG